MNGRVDRISPKRLELTNVDLLGIVMKNQKTASDEKWIFGVYQNLIGGAVTDDGTYIPLGSSSSEPSNIFYADSVLSGSGILSVEPLDEVTVGLCKHTSNELVISQNKAGMCTFDVPSNSVQTIPFDETTNSFDCPSSSTVTKNQWRTLLEIKDRHWTSFIRVKVWKMQRKDIG